jgi:hypothetical protein
MTKTTRADGSPDGASNIKPKASTRADSDTPSNIPPALQGGHRKAMEFSRNRSTQETRTTSTNLVTQRTSPNRSHKNFPCGQFQHFHQRERTFQPFGNPFYPSGRPQQLFGIWNQLGSDSFAPTSPIPSNKFRGVVRAPPSNHDLYIFPVDCYRTVPSHQQDRTGRSLISLRWDPASRASTGQSQTNSGRNIFSEESTGRDSPSNTAEIDVLVSRVQFARDVGPLDIVCGRFVATFIHVNYFSPN